MRPGDAGDQRRHEQRQHAAAAMKPLHGVLVRTTTHENVSPITTASSVPPPQAISELASATCDVWIAEHGDEVVSERSSTPNPSTTGLVLVSAPSSRVRIG